MMLEARSQPLWGEGGSQWQGLGGGQRAIGSARGSLGSRRRRDTTRSGCAPQFLFPPLGQWRVLHALQEKALTLAPVECLAEKRG